jgi:multimeric flavodoxin WrbA
MADIRPLKALALVCTLTPSPEPSSSQLLAEEILGALQDHGVTGTAVRVVDYDVRPGVQLDMGDGDEWPQLRAQIVESDIVALVTPIWLGHLSSIAQRVLERLDAELSEEDSEGRLLTYGKVAVVGVVGNEDGAHHVGAELFQGLNDVGFSLAPGAETYWVGEAMGGVDYKDLDPRPSNVASTTKTLASNAVHLARLLADNLYPPS